MLILLGDPRIEKSGTTVGGFSMGIVGVESFMLDGHGVALGVGAVAGVGTVAGVGVVTGVGTVAGVGACAGVGVVTLPRVGAVAGVEAFARGCAVAEGGAFAGGGAVEGGGGAGCGVPAGGDTVITGALSGIPFVFVLQLSTKSATNQSRRISSVGKCHVKKKLNWLALFGGVDRS